MCKFVQKKLFNALPADKHVKFIQQS